MEDIYKFNPNATYKPNGGQYLQVLSAKDLYKQKIVVSESFNRFDDDKIFPATFPNIFIQYPLGGMKTTDEKWINWQNNPFKLWQTQLNFATWCASSACGISSQHLTNDKHLLVLVLYRFHVYYHIRRIFKQMQTPLPFEDNFNQYNNPYSKEEFLKICTDYGVDSNPMKYRGQYFFSSYQRKHKDYPTPGLSYFTNDSMTRWIVEKSQGFTKPGLFMISESVRAYVYLILSSQASARSLIVGNDASALTAQQAFLNNFEDIVNRRVDIQEDIKRYQDTLNYASSKVDYSVGQGIYMLPSNMDLNIKSDVVSYNNKIIISDTNLNLGINKKINATQTATNEGRAIKQTVTKKSQEQRETDHEVPHIEHPTTRASRASEAAKVSYHEEEKIALILLLTTGFSIWYTFRSFK